MVASYAVARSLPPDERYELARQIRRASTSIPINIAEGAGRRTKRDNVQFLGVARGSLSELEACWLIVEALNYAPAGRVTAVMSLADGVGRMLTTMIHRQSQRSA